MHVVHAGKKGQWAPSVRIVYSVYGMMVFMERDSTRVNENLALKGN